MTYFLKDILRQPDELTRTIHYLLSEGQSQLNRAVSAVRDADHVFLTGMGSSWHAAMSVAPLFYRNARPVCLLDAAELLHFVDFPSNSVIVAISRTGRSVEVVRLLEKAHKSHARVIGVTNSDDGPLARQSHIPILVPVTFDYAISVNTYATLAAAVGAIAATAAGSFDSACVKSLLSAIAETERAIPLWRQQIGDTPWLAPHAVHYFLGRGCSLGSCHESRLLWEEAVKSPATAMGTGAFRHGPQEIVAANMRFAVWIDRRVMREQDLAVAGDLRHLGASVVAIGQDLPENAGNLVFNLPTVQVDWQFLIDIIPMQLAAEHLGRLSGSDCDSFRYCSYVVEDDFGLLRGEVKGSINS